MIYDMHIEHVHVYFRGWPKIGKLKRKIQEAGFEIHDDDAIIKHMAAHHLASRADNTVKKYSSQSGAS